MRILYVEDDRRDADLTVRMLRKAAPHHEVETAFTIHDAFLRLERLSEEPLDLVLTDMHLSDGDGLSLLRHIRENSFPLAVIIVTGMGDEETAVAALKARADDYVVKSKDYLEHLPATLDSALNHYQAEAARREYPLHVLYAEATSQQLDDTRRHFAVHADHIRLHSTKSRAQTLAALQTQESPHHDVLLLDIHQPELESLDLVKKLRIAAGPDTPIVLTCDPLEEDLARQALKLGATRYVIKSPGYLYRLAWVLEDARSRVELLRREAALRQSEEQLKKALTELQQLKDRLQDENVYLKEEIRVASNFGELIGQSESLQKVLHLAERVAPLDTTALILGETGTGKELLAHAIHIRSTRSNLPLVKVNCAALPADIIESELFGHEKGAFTGATARRKGRFEIANHGTIFLDEIGELPLELQAKLLRVLQEGEFEPVGSSNTVQVNVRVIAATNRNLEERVRDGLFRSDLYYRLNIFPITLPPLRERKNDIPLLVKSFVSELSAKFGKDVDTISQDTMAALRNYPWPGNVRELRNVIERAVIITQGSKLDLQEELLRMEAPETSGEHAPGDAHGETLQESQHNLIFQALKKSYWRIEGPYGAAAALNVHPSKLRSMMKKLGITRPKKSFHSTGSV